MNDHLIAAVDAVRAEFVPAERAADLAAARTARLLATVLEQRAAAGVSMGIGAAMIRKLSKSLSAQVEAREEFVMAHKLATALPGELGMDAAMFGDMSECLPDEARVFFHDDRNVVTMRAA